jgi:thioredoxin-related protein
MPTRTTPQLFIALLMLALVAVCCSDDSGSGPLQPVYHDIDKARQAAAAHNLPLLIDFFTDDCKWCKRLDTTVLNTPTAEEYFTSRMVLAKVNGHQQTELAGQYNVSAYPTLILLDTTGSEIDRIVGYREAGPFFSTLDDYLVGKNTLAFLVQRYEEAPNRILAKKIADKYKYRGQAEQAYDWYGEVIATGQPTDSLSAEAKMELADMERRAGNYDEALVQFEWIMNEFADQPFAERAELWRAYVLVKKEDTAAALTALRAFVEHYPGSDQTEWVMGQIRSLTGEGLQE